MSSGAKAEQLAAEFLQQNGLSLLHQNYRCRFGEIDLIMQDGATTVFVEVRLRTRADFGGAAASISKTKQGRLLTTARHYLSTLRKIPSCRFDAVLLNSANGEQIEWVKNAFNA